MVSGRTIWLDQISDEELAALDPGEPEDLDRRPDVLVVGGGMVGVATALACRRAGLGSVLLIEAAQLGSGATGGAAGLLIPEAHLGGDPSALVEMGRASLAQWRALEATSPEGVGFVDFDCFDLSPEPEGFSASPSPMVEWLDAEEVGRLLPGLTSPTSAAHIRHQGRVNPLRALARLTAGVPQIATGVTATAVTQRAGRVMTVSTSAGRITPGAVVFATGSPPRLDGLDLKVPADLVKGHLVVTEPVPEVLPSLRTPFAIRLEDGSLLIGGTLDLDDHTTEVRQEVVDRIRAELAETLPRLGDLRLTHRWCCWRPHHPDGLPVIDRIPGLDNAWVTSGHYRTGILMGPATGSTLAEWIATGERPVLAGPWTIDRQMTPR